MLSGQGSLRQTPLHLDPRAVGPNKEKCVRKKNDSGRGCGHVRVQKDEERENWATPAGMLVRKVLSNLRQTMAGRSSIGE